MKKVKNYWDFKENHVYLIVNKSQEGSNIFFPEDTFELAVCDCPLFMGGHKRLTISKKGLFYMGIAPWQEVFEIGEL